MRGGWGYDKKGNGTIRGRSQEEWYLRQRGTKRVRLACEGMVLIGEGAYGGHAWYDKKGNGCETERFQGPLFEVGWEGHLLRELQ